MIVLGRSSRTEKLYDESESSMDEIGSFEPSETGGFIKVQAIWLKKYRAMKAARGERLCEVVSWQKRQKGSFEWPEIGVVAELRT